MPSCNCSISAVNAASSAALHQRMVGDVRALGGIAGRQPAEFIADDVRIAADRAGHHHRMAARAQTLRQRPGVCLQAAGERLGDRIAQRGDDQDLETVRGGSCWWYGRLAASVGPTFAGATKARRFRTVPAAGFGQSPTKARIGR